jgi:hypothetical protein
VEKLRGRGFEQRVIKSLASAAVKGATGASETCFKLSLISTAASSAFETAFFEAHSPAS